MSESRAEVQTVRVTEPTVDVDVEDAVDRYFEAWNEPDPDRRKALVVAAWASRARSVDPLVDVTGREAICDMIGAVHLQFPGVTVRRTSDIDSHHGQVRFGWEILDAQGSVALSGIDVARLDPDGHVAELVGFFGELSDR